MFLRTTALSGTITSGSYTIGDVVDISSYSNLRVELAASGAIAGTGSLYFTSIAQSDINPASGVTTLPEFGIGQLSAQNLTINGGSGWAYTSASILPIDAKWAIYAFQETSGTVAGTGSVVAKWSLQ